MGTEMAGAAAAQAGAEGAGFEFPESDSFPEDDAFGYDPTFVPDDLTESTAEAKGGDDPEASGDDGGGESGADDPAGDGKAAPDSDLDDKAESKESIADVEDRWAKRFEAFEAKTTDRFEKLLKSQQESQAKLMLKQLQAQGLVDADETDIYELMGMERPKTKSAEEQVGELRSEIDAMRAQARHERIIHQIKGEFVPQHLGSRTSEFEPTPSVFLQGTALADQFGGDEAKAMRYMGEQYKEFVEKVATASREALLAELKEEGIDVEDLRGIAAEKKAGKAPKGRGKKPSRKKRTTKKTRGGSSVYNDPLEEAYQEALKAI